MGHEGHDHHDHDHHHPAPPEPQPRAVHLEHRASAPTQVSTWVVTCSDSRTAATDTGGALARRLLEGGGHLVLGQSLVKDEASAIVAALDGALAAGARAVLFTGGTGLTRRDVTIEALRPRFDKRVDGFGELFRALSFQQIGSAAMASRADAGVVQGALVFALPGSPAAVQLALERLILPELGHLVRELVR